MRFRTYNKYGLALCALLAACSAPKSNKDVTGPPSSPPVVVANPAPASEPPPLISEACRLKSAPQPTPTTHPDFAASAASIGASQSHGFHFGKEHMSWLDVFDLEGDAKFKQGRFWAASEHYLYGISAKGHLSFRKRGDKKAVKSKRSIFPMQALEDSQGRPWLLGRSSKSLSSRDFNNRKRTTSYQVLHWPKGLDDAPTITSLEVFESSPLRLVLTAKDRPALVWASPVAGGASVNMKWLDGSDKVTVLDTREVPVKLANALPTLGLELAAAADGPDGLGFAWRLIVDMGESLDVKGMSELRNGRVSATGDITQMPPHLNSARPVLSRTGIGPWGFYPSGLVGNTLSGQSLFAWQEEGEIWTALESSVQRLPIAIGRGRVEIIAHPEHTHMLVVDGHPPKFRSYRLTCE